MKAIHLALLHDLLEENIVRLGKMLQQWSKAIFLLEMHNDEFQGTCLSWIFHYSIHSLNISSGDSLEEWGWEDEAFSW